MIKTCKKCEKCLTGKQLSYCSPQCSKLHLKSLYKKRNREKLNEYNRVYKSQGMVKPIGGGKRLKSIIASRGGKCERCPATKDLQVHHPRPLRFGGNHKTVLVLCRKCHADWHKRMKGYWESYPQVTHIDTCYNLK